MGFLRNHVARLLGLRLVPRVEIKIKPGTITTLPPGWKPEQVKPEAGCRNPVVGWEYDAFDFVMYARTKSEARARFKEAMGLKRLPVGAIVRRFEQAPLEAAL